MPKPDAADVNGVQGSAQPSTVSDTQVNDKRAFALERTSLLQQLEIDRILSAFRLNPYDVLEVPIEADDKEINRIYRRKSLLIHPDKVKHGEHLCRLITLPDIVH